MSVKFSGINILASDPEKSFAFYKGLGLPVGSEAPPDDPYYGATFDLCGGAVLWIWRDADTTRGVETMPIQIVLGREDIDVFYDELCAAGYAVEPPVKMFYGGREMYLTDPDGNRVLILD